MRLQNKIALITGAGSGIGRAVSLRYAREGAKVVLLGRNQHDLITLSDEITKNGGEAIIVVADLKHPHLIPDLVKQVNDRFGRLDILVGNAAVLGEITPTFNALPSMWYEVMEINLNANYHLIRCFHDLINKSTSGRMIFVTSGITSSLPGYWGPYAASKSALNAMVATYAKEITNFNTKINLLDPGVVATKMRAKAMPGENPNSLIQPEQITEAFVVLAEDSCKHHGEVVHVHEFNLV